MVVKNTQTVRNGGRHRRSCSIGNRDDHGLGIPRLPSFILSFHCRIDYDSFYYHNPVDRFTHAQAESIGEESTSSYSPLDRKNYARFNGGNGPFRAAGFRNTVLLKRICAIFTFSLETATIFPLYSPPPLQDALYSTDA